MNVRKFVAGGLLLGALGVSSLLLAKVSEVPRDWPPDWNGSGVFGQPWTTHYDVSSLKYTSEDIRHIETASLFFRSLHTANWDTALATMTTGEVDHNPNDPKSPRGLMALLASRLPQPRPLQGFKDATPSLLLAHGNYVVIMWDQQAKDAVGSEYPANRFELLRFTNNGKIIEHWDVANRRENSQAWKLVWCKRAARTDCPTP